MRKGFVTTALTLGAVVITSIAVFASSFFLKNKTQTTKTKAATSPASLNCIQKVGDKRYVFFGHRGDPICNKDRIKGGEPSYAWRVKNDNICKVEDYENKSNEWCYYFGGEYKNSRVLIRDPGCDNGRCLEGATNPQPGNGGGEKRGTRCFQLWGETYASKINDLKWRFDTHLKVFSPEGGKDGHIQLWVDGVSKGWNQPWNKGFNNPFDIEPQYTNSPLILSDGQRLVRSYQIKVDECGELGNTVQISCTYEVINGQPVVEGNCFCSSNNCGLGSPISLSPPTKAPKPTEPVKPTEGEKEPTPTSLLTPTSTPTTSLPTPTPTQNPLRPTEGEEEPTLTPTKGKKGKNGTTTPTPQCNIADKRYCIEWTETRRNQANHGGSFPWCPKSDGSWVFLVKTGSYTESCTDRQVPALKGFRKVKRENGGEEYNYGCKYTINNVVCNNGGGGWKDYCKNHCELFPTYDITIKLDKKFFNDKFPCEEYEHPSLVRISGNLLGVGIKKEIDLSSKENLRGYKKNGYEFRVKDIDKNNMINYFSNFSSGVNSNLFLTIEFERTKSKLTEVVKKEYSVSVNPDDLSIVIE